MESSQSIAALAMALSKAQGAIDNAAKDKFNPHFKSKYADLANVVDVVKPALAAHGLSFIQKSHDMPSHAAIETIIIHESGEWISAGIVSVPVSKADAQGYGSANTYARRYSLSAAFGVAAEDDDGNAAAKAKPQFNELPEQIKKIAEATTLDALKETFQFAYKAAEGDADAQKVIIKAKDNRKAEIEKNG